MTKPRTLEQPIHEGVVQLLRFTARPGVVYYHPANGEARNAATGARLKRMGVVPGVADIALVLPGGQSAFLEIKSTTGRQSPSQREFEASVTAAGALYATANSIDAARAVLRAWGAVT
jgi:hypothetical protein